MVCTWMMVMLARATAACVLLVGASAQTVSKMKLLNDGHSMVRVFTHIPWDIMQARLALRFHLTHPHPPPPRHHCATTRYTQPAISLGTCCGSKPDVGLPLWLEAGGVGIDTSIDYHDETNIGAILKEKKIPRSKVYITTKVTAGCGKTPDCGADASIAMDSVHQSLKNLGVEYIDMMLLHRPCEQLEQKCSIAAKLTNCSGPTPLSATQALEANNALWAGLMQAKKAGLVKSIGVSNYFAGQLAALKGDVPAINQCEMSIQVRVDTADAPSHRPFRRRSLTGGAKPAACLLQGYDNATISYCQEKGIVYESYGAMRGCPFSDADLGTIAAAHKVSPAQVCLRWALQHGVVIASGTGSNATTAAAYSKENLAIFEFELSSAEMAKLNDKQL